MKLSYSNSGKQSIGELWGSIAKLSQHVSNDNKGLKEYPLRVREIQLASLEALIKELKLCHDEGN